MLSAKVWKCSRRQEAASLMPASLRIPRKTKYCSAKSFLWRWWPFRPVALETLSFHAFAFVILAKQVGYTIPRESPMDKKSRNFTACETKLLHPSACFNRWKNTLLYSSHLCCGLHNVLSVVYAFISRWQKTLVLGTKIRANANL